jgi:hypothetical protein
MKIVAEQNFNVKITELFIDIEDQTVEVEYSITSENGGEHSDHFLLTPDNNVGFQDEKTTREQILLPLGQAYQGAIRDYLSWIDSFKDAEPQDVSDFV